MPSSAIVEAGQGGVHLSIFAAKSFRSLASRRQAKLAAARGELLVNGVVPSRGHVVQTGERVELMQADKTVVVQPIPSPVKASQNPTEPALPLVSSGPVGAQSSSTAAAQPIDVAYHDDDIAIVWKPAGMKCKGCGGWGGAASAAYGDDGSDIVGRDRDAKVENSRVVASRAEISELLRSGAGSLEEGVRRWCHALGPHDDGAVVPGSRLPVLVQGPVGCDRSSRCWGVPKAAAGFFLAAHSATGVRYLLRAAGSGGVRRQFRAIVLGNVQLAALESPSAEARAPAADRDAISASAWAIASWRDRWGNGGSGTRSCARGMLARVIDVTKSNRFGIITTVDCWPDGLFQGSHGTATGERKRKREPSVLSSVQRHSSCCSFKGIGRIAPARDFDDDSARFAGEGSTITAAFANLGHPVVGDECRRSGSKAKGLMLALLAVQLDRHTGNTSPLSQACAATTRHVFVARPEPNKFNALREREAAAFTRRQATVSANCSKDGFVDECTDRNHTPLAYKLGYTYFCGMQIHVTPDVMIPRMGTVRIVETALQLITAGTSSSASVNKREVRRVLDLGTGSGAILLGLLHRLLKASPQSKLLEPRQVCDAREMACIGVDICPKALLVARQNCASHGFNAIATFVQGDFGTLTATDVGAFDLIVCNPPYADADIERRARFSASAAQAARLDACVREHEPALALLAGGGGLDAYRAIARSLERTGPSGILALDGRVVLEIGHGMADAVANVMSEHNLTCTSILRDDRGLERVLILQREAKGSSLTCRVCHESFDATKNRADACRRHKSLYVTRERNKVLGVIPAPKETRGMVKFWDCCGAEEEDAPGCTFGPHVSYDDE